MDLQAGNVIEMNSPEHGPGMMGILVDFEISKQLYSNDLELDFFFFNRKTNRDLNIKIWRIYWFKRSGTNQYNVGHYSDKAIHRCIKSGIIKLHTN